MAAHTLRFKPTKLAEEMDRILALFPLKETDKTFLEMLFVYAITVTGVSEKILAKSLEKMSNPNKVDIMNTCQNILERKEWKAEKREEMK